MRTRILKAALAIAMLGIAGCGGGGGGAPAPTIEAAPGPTPAPTPTPTRTVGLTWAPNRETAVNQPGGGYVVFVDGVAAATVPFGTGPLAPAETTAQLASGTHTVTVAAFSNLNGGTTSAQSAPVTVTVP